MTASLSDAGGPVTALTADIGLRLQQLVAGWRGAERGEALSALHDQCRAAAGPGGVHLLPDRLLMVKDLDGAQLHKALGRLNGLGRGAALTFRIPPAGRFDAALSGPSQDPFLRLLGAMRHVALS
jgi:hypothetical protein